MDQTIRRAGPGGGQMASEVGQTYSKLLSQADSQHLLLVMPTSGDYDKSRATVDFFEEILDFGEPTARTKGVRSQAKIEPDRSTNKKVERETSESYLQVPVRPIVRYPRVTQRARPARPRSPGHEISSGEPA